MADEAFLCQLDIGTETETNSQYPSIYFMKLRKIFLQDEIRFTEKPQ